MPDPDAPEQQQEQQTYDVPPAPETPASSPSAEASEPTEAKEQQTTDGAGNENAIATGGGLLPPWQIPNSDWKGGLQPKRSTDNTKDDGSKRAQDRETQQQNDDPGGTGPTAPKEWWKPQKPDLTKPVNPFTPQAQEDLREKQRQEALQRADQIRQQKAADDELKRQQQQQRDQARQLKDGFPDNRGDFPTPSNDPRSA